MLADEEEIYFDGGFSRLIHPECEHRLDLPLTWETLIHTLNPALNIKNAIQLVDLGRRFNHPLISDI